MSGLARRVRRAIQAGSGLALAGAVALSLGPTALEGQFRPYAPEEERWLDSGLREDVFFAGVNALVNGVIAGFFREGAVPDAFGEGFRTGAVGGLVTYAGKRLAAERFSGAGLLGRQLASLGGSLSANARDGRGPFDRLVFQLGLGRLDWDRTESRATFRPDLVTLYFTVTALASSRVSFDRSRTWSSGAPVFVTERDETRLDGDAAGRAFAGVLLVDVNAVLPVDEILVHERTHVLQYDQHLTLWGEALERGVFGLFSSGISGVLLRADVGLTLLPFAPLYGRVGRGSNPFEVEADYLTVR